MSQYTATISKISRTFFADSKPSPVYQPSERVSYYHDCHRFDGKIESVSYKTPAHMLTGYYYLILADGAVWPHYVHETAIVCGLDKVVAVGVAI